MNKENEREIDLHQILIAADSATEAAEKALLARFRPDNADSVEAFYKSPNALVTSADLDSDKAIIAALKAAFGDSIRKYEGKKHIAEAIE